MQGTFENLFNKIEQKTGYHKLTINITIIAISNNMYDCERSEQEILRLLV